MEDLAVVVSTKNRYFTSLPLLLTSIVNSNCLPSILLIYDDNDNPLDLRLNPVYSNIFKMLEIQGCKYEVVFGEKRGLTFNHLNSMEKLKKEYKNINIVLRVDDDVILRHDTIERLMIEFKDPLVGAVAPKLYIPDILLQKKKEFIGDNYNEEIYNKLDEINSRDNIQWENPFMTNKVFEVEHLNGSCFLYKLKRGLEMKEKYGYYLQKLSPLCFREDTIWTQGIKRCGWKLKVTTKAEAWHTPYGGSEKNFNNIEKDQKIFEEFIPEKKPIEKEEKENILVVNNGLGDHLVLKGILSRYFSEKHNVKFKLATCYPEVFKTLPVEQISIVESDRLLSKEEIDRCNLYKFMADNKWNRRIEEAYEIVFNRIISIFSNT